jgi:hypothetical protein
VVGSECKVERKVKIVTKIQSKVSVDGEELTDVLDQSAKLEVGSLSRNLYEWIPERTQAENKDLVGCLVEVDHERHVEKVCLVEDVAEEVVVRDYQVV